MAREYRDKVVGILGRKPGPGWDIESRAMMTLGLAEALEEHADALSRAATASDKYAKSVARATWALVAATAALVLATVVPIIVAVCRGVIP